jgi:hypothetical protein
MARSILYIGDKLPVLSAILRYADGTPANLTGYTVQFALRRQSDTTNLFKAAGAVTTPLTGAVAYTLQTGDLATATPGVYYGQWAAANGADTMHEDAGEFEVRRGF